jgi:hypothetical protein
MVAAQQSGAWDILLVLDTRQEDKQKRTCVLAGCSKTRLVYRVVNFVRAARIPESVRDAKRPFAHVPNTTSFQTSERASRKAHAYMITPIAPFKLLLVTLLRFTRGYQRLLVIGWTSPPRSFSPEAFTCQQGQCGVDVQLWRMFGTYSRAENYIVTLVREYKIARIHNNTNT